ncbi:MAG: UDP-N-acetylmuramate--alanine ligase, partial [Nitrospirae bacterium]|nr:UDP-N-acetylmuramate--alanine ligase [Nitrospirota bacterium]
TGIERRFDIYLNNEHGLVIDDYAHNPHKIYSLMQTVQKIRGNICYIFQPHGFAPTMMMKNEYIDVFAKNLRGSDHLMLLPIFYAGGTVSKEISSHDLSDGIKSKGGSVEVILERGDILTRVCEYNNYVIFGARDETLADFSKEIADMRKML